MASDRLTIDDLEDVIIKLEEADYDITHWRELGLQLGLKLRTLNVIDYDNPRDAKGCHMECLTKWLKGDDHVYRRGEPTYNVLADALYNIGHKREADYIRESLGQTTGGKSVKSQGGTASKRFKTTEETGGIEETDSGQGGKASKRPKTTEEAAELEKADSGQGGKASKRPKTTEEAAGLEKADSGTIKKWLREGWVDLTVTRINMHGASGSGKTCTQLLLLNEPPPDSDTNSTPIARQAVKATRISIDDQNMKWERVNNDKLLNQLASDLIKAPKAVSQTSVEEAPEETRTHEQNEREDTPLQKESTDVAKKVLEDIAEKITYAREVKLSTNWAYFIDSGGQPAYRELLPLFTRTAALNIITIDFTKGLEEECGFEYRIGNEKLLINTELKYSNLDIIRSTISSEAILKPIEEHYATEMPSHPYYLVVGTRKDNKEVKTEDIEAMNESLKDCKFSHLIMKNIRESAIIFPVNTLLPAGSKEREEASVELCRVISNCNVSMKIKMPIRLFAFEIALQKEAEKKGRSFLTKNTVVDIGKRLQLNYEEEVEKALQYLHNVTIILYYPGVLPNVVFVDPQPILDILSRLIAITYVDHNQLHLIAKETPSPDARNYLTTSGCFNKKLLKIVGESVFINDQFESHHMIELLKYLHIIAQLENGDYFLPCALPSYDEKKFPPPSTKIKPLLVVWKNDDDKILPVPQGVFPLIVVHLLNQKVYEVKSDSNYYKCYDAMSLHVKVSERSTLHIINRHTHIELYFKGDKKDCPKIWELVNEAIKNSSNGIYVEQSYARAFKCPKDTKEKYCYCIVTSKSSTKCTECTSSYDISPEDDSYWCWVRDSQSASPPVPPAKLFPEVISNDVHVPWIQYKEFSEDLVQDIKVLLMTATPLELQGIMGYLKPMYDDGNIITTLIKRQRIYIGKYGQDPVIVGMSAPGRVQQGPLDACLVTAIILTAIKLRYVIAVGICYGMDESKTSTGDVIVANPIYDCTCLRVENTKDTNNGYTLQLQHRKGIYQVEDTLLSVFGTPDNHFKYSHTQAGKEVTVHCGPIISRPDLVDSSIYKEQLKNLWPNALGGEMEGASIMAAAMRVPSEHKVEAIVIKAICDWGDGDKSKAAGWKPFSSHTAARYVHHQMNMFPGALK